MVNALKNVCLLIYKLKENKKQKHCICAGMQGPKYNYDHVLMEWHNSI